MNERTLKTLEYDKVLSTVAQFAALQNAKRQISATVPESDLESVKLLLDKTEEAKKLLFDYGVGGVEYFDEPGEEIERAAKGSPLTLGEILKVARLLKSSRIARNAFTSVDDETIKHLPAIAENIYCDQYLEKELTAKILSDDKVADDASEKLYQIRKRIKKLNDKIRDELASFVRGQSKYLQDSIVTMRGDRYVVPVKSEHRSKIKGFVHDQSSTGSTVFIEPIEVLELNNELKTTMLEEQNEIEQIVLELSNKIGFISQRIYYNVELMTELDVFCARAAYAYKTKAIKPLVNDKGFIDIRAGRHPLIDEKKVVPVSLTLGKDYRFLLVTGPNTGGKTVTLKLCGLFSLMAASGMFLPTKDGTEVAVFSKVFADVGDEQSIEQSLSTFSSHLKNIVEITENSDGDSLVLIDEIGAGTDPDEGAALAQAVIERLLDKNSVGIITTHYSRLKEYAYTRGEIMNASMEFDQETFAPLYKLNIGAPGSSNAIEIATRLGLSPEITKTATSLLSDNKVSFENVIKEAEKSRRAAEGVLEKLKVLTDEAQEELDRLKAEKEKLEQEKTRFFEKAKADARRIVNEKTEEAEEIVAEIQAILDKAEIDGGDIIRARTLKNKLADKKFDQEPPSDMFYKNLLTEQTAKVGILVYHLKTGTICELLSLPNKKGEVEVLLGSMRVKVKLKELYYVGEQEEKKTDVIKVTKSVQGSMGSELNVVGKRREEALDEVDRFIDNAVLTNQSTVRIVHGVGMKILSSSIHSMLKKDQRVKSFKFADYGDGDMGVTIVEIK
ncbi:MAG: endonuclease MutS2 [Clostridia bacterium]|nr:endonuclease MutS2 [Clostridia bacterium]